MSKRMKSRAVDVPVPRDANEANEWLKQIGDLVRSAELVQAALDEQVAALKAKAEAEAAPIDAAIAAMTKGLQVWAEANREALCAGGRKTVAMSAGEIGWRLRPPSVRIASIGAVMETLKSLGLARFIRTKEEIDKQALLAEPEVAAKVPGVTVGSVGEDFFVQPVALPLSGGGA
ncbi:host-nuclease inhibitor Gam family protein [Bosea sp. (in: a-proteobacteria)]|uniref:host-nuclease inhibitor Gam family protein n=2 Tax=Alphaproteobacteria TaxID=28211 RepID=UPI0025BC0A8E|nr:host-nuclease inhibitor Gam family protein [Bosea sp. (in: a-proteobacteria)]